MTVRLRKLSDLLIKQKLDALFVSNFYNILYLTGFKTLAPEEREAFVVITRRNVYLISDGRYLKQLITNSEERKTTTKNEDLFKTKLLTQEKGLLYYLGEIIKEEKIRTLGFEAEDLKVSECEAFKKKLSVKLVPTEKIIQGLRAIKDKGEITKIKKVCAVADKCLGEIIKTIKIGQTEKEIAFKIEFWLKQKGHNISFQPIVAVNENAAIPHYNTQSGAGKVKAGSLLLIDYGAKVDDYCSDTTRMFFVGKPADSLANVYNKLLDVQEETIKRVILGSKTTPESGKRHPREGEDLQIPDHVGNDKKADSGQARMTLRSIDQFCRKQLEKNGLSNFSHSTGHGVGLEVHESPSVSFRSKDKLQPNQVFTIEPGVYIPGKYGMRIEDVFWVKDNSTEVLTSSPKKLSSLIL